MTGSIERICFSVGGFCGYDQFILTVNKDASARMQHESASPRSTLPPEAAYSKARTGAFLKAFEQTGVFLWKRIYRPDRMVADGIQWSVEIVRKGSRSDCENTQTTKYGFG